MVHPSVHDLVFLYVIFYIAFILLYHYLNKYKTQNCVGQCTTCQAHFWGKEKKRKLKKIERTIMFLGNFLYSRKSETRQSQVMRGKEKNK